MATYDLFADSGDSGSYYSTPQALAGRRRLAEAMLARGIDASPIRHWAQGAGRLAQAIIGGYGMHRADQAEREGLTDLGRLLAGPGPEGVTTPWGTTTARAPASPEAPQTSMGLPSPFAMTGRPPAAGGGDPFDAAPSTIVGATPTDTPGRTTGTLPRELLTPSPTASFPAMQPPNAAAPVTAPAGTRATLRPSRGVRNNNPGNIEFGPFAQQMGAVGTDGRFAIFPTPEAGAQAAEALLVSYMGRGVNTVQGIIDRWAPPSEATNAQNRAVYIQSVANSLGVRPDQPLMPQHIQGLARAMFNVESPGWQTAGAGSMRAPGSMRLGGPQPEPADPTNDPLVPAQEPLSPADAAASPANVAPLGPPTPAAPPSAPPSMLGGADWMLPPEMRGAGRIPNLDFMLPPEQRGPAPPRPAAPSEPAAAPAATPPDLVGRVPVGVPTAVPGTTANAPLPPPAAVASPAAAPAGPAAPAGGTMPANTVLRRLLTSGNPQAVAFGLQLYQNLIRAGRTGDFDFQAVEGSLYRVNKRTGEAALVAGSGQGRPPEAIRTQAIKADQAFRNLSSALDGYQRLVQETGASVLPGQEADAIRQARTNIQMQLKELFNLGVLNGPDLMLMEQMLVDPSVGIGLTGPYGVPNLLPGNAAARVQASVERLQEMLRGIRNTQVAAIGLPPIPPPTRQQPGGDGFSIRRLD
jgi:hypothetical protein